MMPVDHRPQRIAQIAQQMPAVRDLDRRWRAVGVSPRAVTGDDLDTRVRPEPSGQGLGLPIRQQVDDLVALEIDQGGAVAVAAPERPVVDAQHPGWRSNHRGLAHHQAQQRVRADRHGEPLGQPSAGLAAGDQADLTL